MRYVSILALWHFFFIQVHCGYWGISCRALYSHWESVQWVDGPWSLPLHVLGIGGFLGGPYVAIGSLFNGLMALCHFHSMFGHWGLFVPWFALSHLLPPSHSLTLTTLTGLRQCFACIKSSPCINNGLGLVGFVPIFA